MGPDPLSFGSLNIDPQERRFNIYQVNDTLSHSRGGHILSMGFDVRRIQDHSQADTNTRGIFTFSSLAGFLSGLPVSWTQLFGSTQRDLRTGVYSFFFQDDWKVRPTLTVNLGARWEVQGALNEAHGRLSRSRSGAAGRRRRSRPRPAGKLSAWAVRRSTATLSTSLPAWASRGTRITGNWCSAAAMASIGTRSRSTSSPPRVRRHLSITSPVSPALAAPAKSPEANSFDNLVNGTATIQSQTQAQLGSFGTQPNFGSVNTVNPQLRNPYTQQYSLGMEYQFARSYMFGLSYVGSKGTHLTRLIPINPVVNGPAPATSLADEIARFADFVQAYKDENGRPNGLANNRLDPRFDQVNRLDDGGSSIYHSLQVTGNKSFSHGLQFQASYTWSKSIDDASDYYPAIQANDNSFAQDGSKLDAERAVSNFDIRHRIMVTEVWQVPFFHNRKGLAGKALDGWSFESVNLWQSAVPATVLAGTVQNPSGGPLTVPDVNLDGNFISPGFDNTRANCDPAGTHFTLGAPAGISGFSQPLVGNDGTCGRNSVRMNSLTNFDWSFFKDTELTESGPWGSGPWKLQFRAEMYNIFNIPFLTAQGTAWRTAPASPSSSSLFGTVNAAGNSRKMQLALKLIW